MSAKKLYFRFTEKEIQGIVTLNEEYALQTCSVLWEALKDPISVQAMHAMFAGPEIMTGLPKSAQTFDPRTIPPEDQTCLPFSRRLPLVLPRQEYDVWIAPYAQDYTHTLTKAGLPIKFLLPEEGTPAVFITVNAVASRPNTDLAIKFIDFSIRAEAQAGWSAALRYSPTNRATKLSPELAEQVIYGKQNIDKLVKFDPIKINANRAAWTDLLGMNEDFLF